MKKLILKYIGFGNECLDSFVPDNPKDFCLWLDLSIGFLGEDGGNLFQVGICTPIWLAHQVAIQQIVVPRNLLVVDEFCFDLIKKKIEEIISQSTRDSGADSMAALSRYFSWEFEI
ncbi:Imm8 family immunity protein [Achromobacter deleyi]|uniref:Imm8 family immunity protein n=1 Tax=Achromobacter deleyi TaxID=1353891 RepID=UPI00158326B6|nr:Imm8 family immunity protein [Achromobacter deleyi]